jgi:hypothetical protein
MKADAPTAVTSAAFDSYHHRPPPSAGEHPLLAEKPTNAKENG